MNIEDKIKLNREISDVLNKFVGSLNNDVTRSKIGYEIRNFLEREEIEWETLNLYTSPDKVDKCLIDIKIDGETYPFIEIEKINEDNWFELCIRWENQQLSDEDTIILFQYLIDEGHAWELQGLYGRTAEDLIREGYCTLSYN